MLPPPLSKADLHLLYVFASVVEARGFSAAQVELNVSASTISRQISDLEARLGMKLCQRGRSGFLLTEDGALVYQSLQNLFAAVRAFDDAVRDSRGRMTGHLSVASVDNWVHNPASCFFQALRAFLDEAPDVTIELHALAPDDIEMAVIDGRVSLGVGVFHRHKSQLAYEQVGTERMGLYCAKGHPLFEERDPQQVQAILKTSRYAKRTYLRERDVAPVSRGLQTNARAHQMEGIAQLILTGRYIGYLPAHFAHVWLRDGRMWSVGQGAYDQSSDIKMVKKRGSELNTPSRRFEELILHCAAGNGRLNGCE